MQLHHPENRRGVHVPAQAVVQAPPARRGRAKRKAVHTRVSAVASLLQVLSEPWRLSTSQIAQFQIRMFDPDKYPKHLGAGGGFGPVSALGEQDWAPASRGEEGPEVRPGQWAAITWAQAVAAHTTPHGSTTDQAQDWSPPSRCRAQVPHRTPGLETLGERRRSQASWDKHCPGSR